MNNIKKKNGLPNEDEDSGYNLNLSSSYQRICGEFFVYIHAMIKLMLSKNPKFNLICNYIHAISIIMLIIFAYI